MKLPSLVRFSVGITVCTSILLLVACQQSNIHLVKKIAPEKKNILFIAIDDLRPELKSFGADYIHSPNIDQLANKGRAFHQHFVNAPTCGASRYSLLTGRYGSANNNALFERAKKVTANPTSIPPSVHPSMPEWFKKRGYNTVSVGKISHHSGGLGGKTFEDENQVEVPNAWHKSIMPIGEWQHPFGATMSLANGEIRNKPKDMAVFQNVEGPDSTYSDGHIAQTAITQLTELANQDKPFFLAVGFLKPHLPFGAPKKYLDLYDDVVIPDISHANKPKHRSTWHKSSEFRQYNHWGKDPREDNAFAIDVKRRYAACVSYVDNQVGKVLAALKATGADKNTVVVLWGDHGWHLGEHGVWGKHTLFDESLRSPLIIYYPDIEQPGQKTNAVVETVDIFPTLAELAGIDLPSFSNGQSLTNILNNAETEGHSALAYRGNSQTLRTSDYRFTLHKSGYAELYDQNSQAKETQNIAKQSTDLVKVLTKQLLDKSQGKRQH